VIYFPNVIFLTLSQSTNHIDEFNAEFA